MLSKPFPMDIRARSHCPNSLGFAASPPTAVPTALSHSSLRKALLDIAAATAHWLLKPNFPFTCSNAVSGLQSIHPVFHKKNSQQTLSGPASFHLEELHRGLQKGCARKKADPSFSPLTTCALPSWAFLSYSMSIMLKFHQFRVLIWKHMNVVTRRKQKKNWEPQAGHQSLESACENPSLPLHSCSMEVEWY